MITLGLLLINSVLAVVITPDIDIVCENYQFNTKTSIDFDSINWGADFLNYSYDGTTFYNTTYTWINNITSSEALIELNGNCGQGNYTTEIGFDAFSPIGWIFSSTSTAISNNSMMQTIGTFTGTTINTTHQHYTTTYNPQNSFDSIDLGYFDINISGTFSNSTLQYTGYNTSDDVFEVYELLPINNVSSSYNATYNSLNFTWGRRVTEGYYYNESGADQWANSPERLIDGDIATFSKSGGSGDNHNLSGNTFSDGADNIVTRVRFRVMRETYLEYTSYILYVTPRINGTTDTEEHAFSLPADPAWTDWIDITHDANTPSEWNLTYIDNLDFNLRVAGIWGGKASKLELEITYINDTIGPPVDRYIVVRSNSSQPSCPSGGYEVQNTTGNIYNTVRDFTIAYFTVFTYNNTTNSYSRGTSMPWGGIQLQCFNESNTSQAINFNIEISNLTGSEVYTASDVSNGEAISFDNIPYGEGIILVVTNSSYKLRTYNKNLNSNNFYNLTFYLPPHETYTPGGGGGGGGDDENYTDTQLYVIQVIDAIDRPLEDVDVTIKKYIDRTDTYEEISSGKTDSNGVIELYLISSSLYKINLVKQNYETKNVNYIPDPDFYGIYYPKILKMFLSSNLTEHYDFNEHVTFTANMYQNGTINIRYYNDLLTTSDVQLYLYETYDGINTLLSSAASSISQSYLNLSYTGANTSRQHYAHLYFNHTLDFDVVCPLTQIMYQINISYGSNYTVTASDLEYYFTAAFGENQLGWGNSIAVFSALIMLCVFGPFHAGLGIIGAGVTLACVELAFVVNNPVLLSIIPIAMGIGFFYILVKNPEVHV